jgi:hypothetical protein
LRLKSADIDLSQALVDEDLRAVRDAFAEYAVLIFPATDEGLAPLTVTDERR